MRANLNEIAAPAAFRPTKTAYSRIHHTQVGSSSPSSTPVMPFRYPAEKYTITAVVATYSMVSASPVTSPPHGPMAPRANE
jgi:hypothetical protein